MSSFHPVSAFEQDVSYCLRFIATLTLVGVSLVDSVEVGPQANLARTHLCDCRTNCSVCPGICIEYHFPGPHSESNELSTVFALFLS